MKKVYLGVMVLGVCSVVALSALAQSGAEDQAIGILERVLNVIADFLDRVFGSMADAVKSLWADDGGNTSVKK